MCLISDFLLWWPLILNYKNFVIYIALKQSCRGCLYFSRTCNCRCAEILRCFCRILCGLRFVGKVVWMSLPRKRYSDLQNKYICGWHSHRKLPSICFCCLNSLILLCWCIWVRFLLCTFEKLILYVFETLAKDYLGKLSWNKKSFHFHDLT